MIRALALALTCIATLVASPAQAQFTGSSAVGAPLWEVHLHLQKSFASPLGQRLLEIFEKEEPGKFAELTKLFEAIGLDPRTEIGEVALFGDGFEETDATLIAKLGSSTGNLEGWILAAPGYRSEDLDDNTQLHSMTVEGKTARAWFAAPKHTPSGNYILIGSLNRERTTEIAHHVLSAPPSPVPNPLEGNAILAFAVHDLSAVPLDIDENEPGAAIVQIIEQVGLKVASDTDNLSFALDISTSSAGKARQIGQLLTGLKALTQLAPLEEPQAQKAAQIMESLVIDHTEGQSSVRASLSAPYQILEEFISEID